MVPLVPGWSWSYLDDAYVMTSDHGVITYRERCRPLVRIKAILRQVMARDPATRWDPPAPAESLLTAEGEHAALARLTGVRGDQPVEESVGMVFADDFYALLVGRGDAEVHTTVRALLPRDLHQLGVRRRRFLFTPPAGWGALAMSFHAIYLAPDYPRARGMITVYPAVPRKSGDNAVESTLAVHAIPALNFAPDELRESLPVQGTAGLTGTLHELRGSVEGRPAVRLVATLEDQAYVYALSLDTTEDARAGDLAVFTRVIASAKPIGGPPAPAGGDTEAASQWTD